MAERAFTRQDVVSFIESGEIECFRDIFYKCKYPIARVSGAVSSNKQRLTAVLSRPYDITLKEIFRIAWYFDVHYLVIFRLIERQFDPSDYGRTFFIAGFDRPKEDYPKYILEAYRENKKEGKDKNA